MYVPRGSPLRSYQASALTDFARFFCLSPRLSVPGSPRMGVCGQVFPFLLSPAPPRTFLLSPQFWRVQKAKNASNHYRLRTHYSNSLLWYAVAMHVQFYFRSASNFSRAFWRPGAGPSVQVADNCFLFRCDKHKRNFFVYFSNWL